MTPTQRGLRLVAAALALLLVGYIVWIVHLAGELRLLPDNKPLGDCQTLPLVIGAEDAVMARDGARIYVVSVDRRAHSSDKGAIFALDTAAATTETDLQLGRHYRKVTGALPFAFHPHGLGVDQVEGRDRAWVVNHRSGEVLSTEDDSIEVFEAENSGFLQHQRTITDPLLVAVNDVAPAAGGFYATIDHRHPSGVMRRVEDYGRFAWSTVVWWHGGKARQVASGLRYANGVAVSADGERVFVAATTDRAVLIFERGDDGGLKELARTNVQTGVDNVTVAANGRLWIASHPKLLTFLRHAANASVQAPTEVLSLDAAGGPWRQVAVDDGGKVAAAAVAIPLSVDGEVQRVVLGPVFGPLRVCGLPRH